MSILSSLFGRRRQPVMGSPAANDSVRAQLSAHGDDGSNPRHVVHYAYPGKTQSDSLRRTMTENLLSRGFQVRDAASGDGFVLEQTCAVSPEEFDRLTAELSAWFAERGWEYDGWECAVVTDKALAI